MTNSDRRRVFHVVRDVVRSQLWPIPVLGVLLALALGVFLPRVDAGVDTTLPTWLAGLVFGGDAAAARTVLDAVASSLVTVTSLTFSLTVVTLQLASSQFSPRLLRTFTQDLFVQVTLAVFLATFTYALTVLRTVRSADGGSSPFVPRLAVTTSFLLALASVVCLVLFLAHLTRQIRVEIMLEQVRRQAHDTVVANLGSARQTDDATMNPPLGAVVWWARRTGFLQQVDHARLVAAAQAGAVIVSVDREPGSFVVEGTPLGRIWSDTGGPLDPDGAQEVVDRLAKAIRLGPERTGAQDVGFGLRQLVDVANKALSPGINDPTTAIHAIGHVGAVLAELTERDLGPVGLRDDQGRLRAVLAQPDFAQLLELSVDQPRRYGRDDAQVLGGLYRLLGDVAWRARPEHRAAIRAELHRLDETVAGQDFDDDQRDRLRGLGADVVSALEQRTGAVAH